MADNYQISRDHYLERIDVYHKQNRKLNFYVIVIFAYLSFIQITMEYIYFPFNLFVWILITLLALIFSGVVMSLIYVFKVFFDIPFRYLPSIWKIKNYYEEERENLNQSFEDYYIEHMNFISHKNADALKLKTYHESLLRFYIITTAGIVLITFLYYTIFNMLKGNAVI